MRSLLHRLSSAAVKVDAQPISQFGQGLVILLGIGQDDNEAAAEYLTNKIANLRVFDDEDGKTNLSMLDVTGSAIVVSQFTL